MTCPTEQLLPAIVIGFTLCFILFTASVLVVAIKKCRKRKGNILRAHEREYR